MRTAALFLAAFGLFVHNASPTVSFEDTGEIALAAVSLGVTHPPGYPWLVMLGSLFARIPAGDPAFRLCLLSACLGAAAVVFVFLITLAVLDRLPVSRAARLPAAVFASAAFALSRTLLWQSTIGEKYTLSIALLMMTVFVLLKFHLERRESMLFAGAFSLGLALSHHLHGLYLVPLAALVLAGLKPAPRRIGICVFLLVVPVAAKAAVIPIRSAANPPLNWGAPDNSSRLLAYMSARQYKRIMFSARGAADVAARAVEQAAVNPIKEFGPAAAAAAPGIAVLLASAPALAWGALCVFAANFALAMLYPTPEIERYYLLSFGLIAVLTGAGMALLLSRFRTLAAAVAAALVLEAAVNVPLSSRARHYLAHDFAVNQINPLPKNAALICEGDDQAFPLFYLSLVSLIRPDATIVPMPFFCERVMYGKLASHFSDFSLPAFTADPGRHLPRIIWANSSRRAFFYTPGCTGFGSENYLVPFGIVFQAHFSPSKASESREAQARFPELRLRGVHAAARYRDPVSLRAAENYAVAYAYRGAAALEGNRLDEAAVFLKASLGMPSDAYLRAAANSHLALISAVRGDLAKAGAFYRESLRAKPDFAPSLMGLAKVVLLSGGNRGEARDLLERAAANPEFLSRTESAELRSLMGRTE